MRNSLLWLILLLSPVALAQQPLIETIEVRVANVDVVVTDKAGNPVQGLTRDDFELLEDGRKQPLTNFYEVRGDALVATATGLETATAPQPEVPARRLDRRFVLFLDDYSVHLSRRTAVLDSLDRFIDAHLLPGDTVSLVQWQRGIHMVVPPTSDKAVLHRGIAQLRKALATTSAENEENRIKTFCRMQAGGSSPRQMPGQGRQLCMDEVSAYEMQATFALRDLLTDIRAVIASLAGIDGKKILVLAGSQLPERPGLELYHFANVLFGGMSAAGQAVMQTRSERPSIEKLARAANADGVTIYAIDTQEQHGGATAESSDEYDPMEDFTRFVNSAVSYQSLAGITGGRAVTQTKNFDEAFETVARDLGSYYSLGYRPADSGNTGNRKVTVKTKNPALVVRARKSYAVKTADEQMGDRVVANIFHEGISGEWPVEIRPGKPVKNGRNFNVPVEVLFPAKLTLLPQGTELAGGFSVFIGLADEQGRTAEVVRRVQPLHIPAAAESALRAKPIVFSVVIMMRPGTNTLSVGVVDSISGEAGYARASVDAR